MKNQNMVKPKNEAKHEHESAKGVKLVKTPIAKLKPLKAKPNAFSKIEEKVLEALKPIDFVESMKKNLSSLSTGRKSLISKEWLLRRKKYKVEDLQKARKELASLKNKPQKQQKLKAQVQQSTKTTKKQVEQDKLRELTKLTK